MFVRKDDGEAMPERPLKTFLCVLYSLLIIIFGVFPITYKLEFRYERIQYVLYMYMQIMQRDY